MQVYLTAVFWRKALSLTAPIPLHAISHMSHSYTSLSLLTQNLHKELPESYPGYHLLHLDRNLPGTYPRLNLDLTKIYPRLT